MPQTTDHIRHSPDILTVPYHTAASELTVSDYAVHSIRMLNYLTRASSSETYSKQPEAIPSIMTSGIYGTAAFHIAK